MSSVSGVQGSFSNWDLRWCGVFFRRFYICECQVATFHPLSRGLGGTVREVVLVLIFVSRFLLCGDGCWDLMKVDGRKEKNFDEEISNGSTVSLPILQSIRELIHFGWNSNLECKCIFVVGNRPLLFPDQ